VLTFKQDPYVTVTDLGSSHGTYLIRDQNLDAAAAISGGKRCETGTAVKICNGDILRFGSKVTRGTGTFGPPLTMLLSVDTHTNFYLRDIFASHIPSLDFQVSKDPSSI
jgi:hypothetical protein